MNRYLEQRLSSPVYNYATQGLTSRLLAGWQPRMFTTDGGTDFTLPHSHRYDFLSIVLEGSVVNRIWTSGHFSNGRELYESTLEYRGKPGEYTAETDPYGPRIWSHQAKRYERGQCYFMTSNEIHSIAFAPGSEVLILEGPTIRDRSVVLHPGPEFVVDAGLFTTDPSCG